MATTDIQKTYVVAFEVSSPAVRERLATAMKSFGTYCPVHANCWALKTTSSAVAIRDLLGAQLGIADRVFVIRSGTEAAWQGGYGEKNDQWLKTHL
jgi:hypothetical protein